MTSEWGYYYWTGIYTPVINILSKWSSGRSLIDIQWLSNVWWQLLQGSEKWGVSEDEEGDDRRHDWQLQFPPYYKIIDNINDTIVIKGLNITWHDKCTQTLSIFFIRGSCLSCSFFWAIFWRVEPLLREELPPLLLVAIFKSCQK